MAKVTLQDLLDKKPEDVLKQMKERDPVSEEKPELPPESPKKIVSKIKINRDIYKAFFQPGHEFVKGQEYQITDHTLQVINIERSSGRIRFIRMDTQEVFSLSLEELTGVEPVMPYKKGDQILFEGKKFVVTGLNPASKNVVIDYEGRSRYVKITKIVKVDEPNSSSCSNSESAPAISGAASLTASNT